MSGRGVNPIFGSQGTSIFAVMSALATSHGAINLAQGFPDEDGPMSVREEAARILREGPNQYPPMIGMPALRKAIAGHSRHFYDLNFDPDAEVLVTTGATEALTASLMALTAPGDEVIIIEPAYDLYRPVLEAMGARVKAVRLEPPHFRLEEAALAAAFSDRTKLIVINTPLNPVGRVFDRSELDMLASFIKRYDTLAVCDEVYEHLVFGSSEHIPLISLTGMRERCVRIGSAGKIFSLTGWKIGWVQGPAALVSVIAKAHQFLTFTVPPALQLGVAYGLEHEMQFTLDLRRALETKGEFLRTALAKLGFDVLPSQGTYFLTAGIAKLTKEPDRAFCEKLTREAGVAAVPFSPFYAGDAPKHLLRFAVCKKREVLEDSVRRLEAYFAAAPAQ